MMFWKKTKDYFIYEDEEWIQKQKENKFEIGNWVPKSKMTRYKDKGASGEKMESIDHILSNFPYPPHCSLLTNLAHQRMVLKKLLI